MTERELWYRKNDSAIIAYKEKKKRRKRRTNVGHVVGPRFETGFPWWG